MLRVGSNSTYSDSSLARADYLFSNNYLIRTQLGDNAQFQENMHEAFFPRTRFRKQLVAYTWDDCPLTHKLSKSKDPIPFNAKGTMDSISELIAL